MTKLVFIHHMKFTREHNAKTEELQLENFNKYKSLAKKNGLKLLAHGTPWGNEYHWVGVLQSDKGMEAWNAFINEYISPEYMLESNTAVVSQLEF